jgi:hypothetical protein
MLNATATACAFKFCRRNPKIIMRWPRHVTGDTPDKTGDLGKGRTAEVKPNLP